MRELVFRVALAFSSLSCLGGGYLEAADAPAAAAADFRPQVGPASPEILKLAGKNIQILGYVDIDGDNAATEVETYYLVDELQKAGANVTHSLSKTPLLKSGDILILNDPIVPNFTSDELFDPINEDQNKRAQAMLDAFLDGGRAQLLADAKTLNVTVIDGSNSSAFFGLAKGIYPDLKRFGFQEYSRVLDRSIPVASFKDFPLANVADFVADVSHTALTIDWQSLARAGIARDKRFSYEHGSPLPVQELIEAVLKVAGDGKLVLLSDGNQLLITSNDNAALRRKRRPGGWLTPAELRSPPPEALLPGPALPAAYNHSLKQLNLPGVNLSDVLDFLKDVCGVKIEADWNALAPSKITGETQITVPCAA